MSLFAPEARAETIADGAGFSMDLDPRVKDVCVFIPEGKADEKACDGVDVVGAAAAVMREEKTPIFAAIGHVGDWKLMIMATREPAKAELEPKQLDGFAATLRQGMSRGGAELVEPFPPATMTRINGVQVVDVTTLAHAGRRVDDKLWMNTSSVIAASAVYLVWTTTEAAHASEASDIVQASLHTLKAAPHPAMPTEEKYARTGDFIGRILGGVAALVFLVFVIWLGLRNRAAPMPTEADGPARPKRKRKVVSWEKNKDG